ncbi:MAG: hypothetical protein RMJ53_10415 [Chitinophagales bacterium]|nr:hypothetical protein [Chitinophagales bacterium]
MKTRIAGLVFLSVVSCTGKKDAVKIINDNCKTDVEYCTIQMFQDTIDREEDSYIIDTFFRHIPLYVGKDTNIIDLSKPGLVHDFIHDIGKGSNYRRYPAPDTTNTKFYLDTTMNVNYRYFESQNNYEKEFNICSCKGYVFIIKNISKDTLMLGEGDNVPIVLQGMSPSGEWNNLHRPYLYMDNYGIGFLLPPGNIALFSIPKIKSEYYKRYRVVYYDWGLPKGGGVSQYSRSF